MAWHRCEEDEEDEDEDEEGIAQERGEREELLYVDSISDQDESPIPQLLLPA